MAANTLNSLMPLWLYVILREKSSAQNPLSRFEIEKILTDEYYISIGEKDRNKTKRCINALCDYFAEKNSDGEIVGEVIVETEKQVYYEKGRKKVSAWYLDASKLPQHVGNLSADEVNLLTDMVNDCQAISSECTSGLIHRLAASLSEADCKVIRGKKFERGTYKSEYKYLYEIKGKAEEAIESNRQLTITYAVDGVEDDFVITPIKIDHKDGEFFILGYRNNKLKAFSFDNIRFIDLWKENVSHSYVGQTTIDTEDSKKNKAIALDALFSNTRVIRDAINNKQYLSFSYCTYTMQDNKVKLTQSDPQNVIPIKTAYKNRKPYLIAIDPQNYQPVFFRIDLMKEVGTSGQVDSWEYRKFDIKDNAEYTDKHPFMLSGFTIIRARFLIKADCLDRVIDAFGLNVKFFDKKKAAEFFDGNSGKLARAFPDLDLDLGFDNDDILVAFEVHTTDEEAIRFALQNGDVVELLNPELRERVLHIAEAIEKRHTHSECDRERKAYQSVISGDEFLKLTSSYEPDKKALWRIEKEKAYDKVKKLHIGYSKEPICVEDLKKYTNLQELIIDGNNMADFSWIKKLSSLRSLKLTHTSIENGDVLAEIPQLDLLFLNGNYSLSDYGFLKNMKITSLYIGNNGKAEVYALYELTGVSKLVVEEKLLFDLDVERLENIRIEVDGRLRHMRVSRWIEGGSRNSKLPSVYDVNPQLFRIHKN